MNLITPLSYLGFSDKEAEVYLANLELGPSPASTVAKKAGLHRTTCYSVLCELEKKGYTRRFERARVHYFSALTGKEVEEKLQKQHQKNIQNLTKILPVLTTLQSSTVKPPKIQSFEGFEGMKQIYEDTLIGDHSEKLAYSSISESKDEKLRAFIDEYTKKRTKNGISVRAILPDTKNAREMTKNDHQVLRTSQYVQTEKFQFKSEINIYGNKVAILSLIPPYYHGVIIESPEISETQKAIFELVWR